MQTTPAPIFVNAWRGWVLALCLWCWAPPGLADADSPPASAPVSTVAIIPFYSPEKIWSLYTPFIDYLKSETGLPWELKLYPDHNSLIEELCGGQLAIALLGPIPLGRVLEKCGATPTLVALDKEGNPTYRSIMISGDPAVKELGDLKGKKFGFFKGSTAAHIVPLKMLLDNGLGNAIQPVFLESQDRIMTALLTNELAGAGVKEGLYRKFKSEPLRVLQSSSPLPNFAFCPAPALPAALKERFAAALLKLQPRTSPVDRERVGSWDDEIKNGFVAASPDYVESVRQLHHVYHEVTHED